MRFPNEWPPEEAVSCSGDYFHIPQEDPPGADDLKCFQEKGRKLRYAPSCACMPYGLSVFTDRADALHMQKAMHRIGGFIGTLNLTATDGKVMLTPGQQPTHDTWWPSCECDRKNRVAKVEKVA